MITYLLRFQAVVSGGCAVLLFSVFGLAQIAMANSEKETLDYLKSLSIEELLETQVTSVSKRPEPLFDAAAAITVITAEDLRRIGARTIPDALRLVPGLKVAQVNSSRWEVGARGFSDFFETKLLVLIDGRSMYTPLYSGVYWNSLDTVIEDIERIEVIRGPGATIWGANAVNGVINIITKNSADTQGGLLSTTIGTYEEPLVTARYGGKINPKTSYRFYAKGFQRDNYKNSDGSSANDGWESYRTGFRADSELNTRDTLSVQGEVFSGEADFNSVLSGFLTPPFVRESQEVEDFYGGHFLIDYGHAFSDRSKVEVAFYYDTFTRDLVVAQEERNTLDFEFKHHLDLNSYHDIVWGAGVRWSQDEVEGTFSTSFDPASESLTLWNFFIQDDIMLVEDTFWVTLGTKLEYNSFTGFELQPSIRARFRASADHLFWGAISRAVRTPSRSDQDIVINLGSFQIPPNPVNVLRLIGNSDFDSEELIAYELGYRWRTAKTFSLDIAVFYNSYDDLLGIESGTPFFETSYFVVPQELVNNLERDSYGVEVSACWQVRSNFRLQAGYSWIDLEVKRQDGTSSGALLDEDSFPRHQVKLWGNYDFTKRLSFNSEVYWVDEFETDDIDDYLRLDVQLIWQPTDALELAIGAENLFNSRHLEAEIEGSNIQSSEVVEQFWLKATYTF